LSYAAISFHKEIKRANDIQVEIELLSARSQVRILPGPLKEIGLNKFFLLLDSSIKCNNFDGAAIRMEPENGAPIPAEHIIQELNTVMDWLQ
jgi:hypothetical protein